MENSPSGPEIYLRANATKTVEDPESFWKKRSALTQQRLSDPALHQVAFDEMKKQSIRLPVYYQKPLEVLLEEAHEMRAVFMSFIGRKGGKCKDRLQILIVEIVDKDPAIDCRRLLHRLKAQRTFGVISDVTDDVISFEDTARFISAAIVVAMRCFSCLLSCALAGSSSTRDMPADMNNKIKR
jgi:hypothetical protein